MSDPRRERLACVLDVGRKIADPSTELGREARTRLSHTSQLSPQGVALALRHHMATKPTDAELDTLLERAPTAVRCHVSLAANVCVAPFRAIAWALACAPSAFVRASRRDPALTELIVAALRASPRLAAAGGEVTRCDVIAPSAGDHVHLYGSDATIAALMNSLPVQTPIFRHGSGMGVALVPPGSDLNAAACALARDLVPFDGAGCLSPRVALVAANIAERFVEILDRELCRQATVIPRGALSDADRSSLTLLEPTYAVVGRFVERSDHFIAFDSAPEALLPAPALRGIVVAAVRDVGHMMDLLSPWLKHTTACGSSGTTDPWTRALASAAPDARHGKLGAMQTPPLDGPVDLRSQTRYVMRRE